MINLLNLSTINNQTRSQILATIGTTKTAAHLSKQASLEILSNKYKELLASAESPEKRAEISNTFLLAIKVTQENVNHNGINYFTNTKHYGETNQKLLELLLSEFKPNLEQITVHRSGIGNTKRNFSSIFHPYNRNYTNYSATATSLRNLIKNPAENLVNHSATNEPIIELQLFAEPKSNRAENQLNPSQRSLLAARHDDMELNDDMEKMPTLAHEINSRYLEWKTKPPADQSQFSQPDHGHNFFELKNGDTYKGDYRAGLPQGYGSYTFKNSNVTLTAKFASGAIDCNFTVLFEQEDLNGATRISLDSPCESTCQIIKTAEKFGVQALDQQAQIFIRHFLQLITQEQLNALLS